MAAQSGLALLIVINDTLSQVPLQEVDFHDDLYMRSCYYGFKYSLPGGTLEVDSPKVPCRKRVSPLTHLSERYEEHYRAGFLLPTSHFPHFLQGRGCSMSQESFVSQIPLGREGWVYLIHAKGTNRYKIGRSIKPIERRNTLQKQAPYPLEIIDSYWTPDAQKDEAAIHQNLENLGRSMNIGSRVWANAPFKAEVTGVEAQSLTKAYMDQSVNISTTKEMIENGK